MEFDCVHCLPTLVPGTTKRSTATKHDGIRICSPASATNPKYTSICGPKKCQSRRLVVSVSSRQRVLAVYFDPFVGYVFREVFQGAHQCSKATNELQSGCKVTGNRQLV